MNEIPTIYTAASGAFPRIGKNSKGHKLRKVHTEFAKRLSTIEALHEAENEVAAEIVSEQEEVGLDILTDGLVRWFCPISHIAGRMEGVGQGEMHHFLDTNFHVRKAVVESLPQWKVPLIADELRFVATLTQRPIKAVLTGPATFLRYMQNESSHDDITVSIAYVHALQHEIELLSTLDGISTVSIDDPCLLDQKYPWVLFFQWYLMLYEAVHSGKRRLLLEIKTYGKPCADFLSNLFALPCDYLGFDCVTDKKIILRILQKPELLLDSKKGLALGVVDARNKIMEDPFMVERVVEPLFFYTKKSLILEPSRGLELLPRRYAKEKLNILVRTKEIFLDSALYKDTCKIQEKKSE